MQQEDETPEVESERYQPLETVFSKSARQQIRELPGPTARLGLRLLGELAAGVDTAWGKCQRLKQMDDVFSARLGREYRLLSAWKRKKGCFESSRWFTVPSWSEPSRDGFKDLFLVLS